MQALYEYGEAIPCVGLTFIMAIVLAVLIWNNLPSYENKKKKPDDKKEDKPK